MLEPHKPDRLTLTSANGRFAQSYAVVFQVTADDHLPDGVDPGTITPGDPGTDPGDGGEGEQPGTGGGSNLGTGAGAGAGSGSGADGSAAAGTGSSADGDLAFTGSNTGVIASIATLLLAFGALAVLERRRRRAAAPQAPGSER